MAVFNAAKREIDIKIVYYGPALCGKTTNVQCIHRLLAPEQRGELTSLATKDDRTLFFDFLPIELGDVKGFKTRFHVYTVPGQVYYALTRRAVLTGVDGVVFVADSQKSKLQENIESLQDLSDNLKYYKKDLATLPFILQYNKRDLTDILPIEELNSALNHLKVPFFEASALQGTGVVETLTAICKAVLAQMDKARGKKARPTPHGAEQPAAATAPQPQTEPETTSEPVITIFRDIEPGPVPETHIPPKPPEHPSWADVGAAQPRQTTFQLKEEPVGAVTEPEISIDTFVSSGELHIPPSPLQERMPEQPDRALFGTEGERSGQVRIISCGEPERISDTMVRVPLCVSVGRDEQRCTICITISIS